MIFRVVLSLGLAVFCFSLLGGCAQPVDTGSSYIATQANPATTTPPAVGGLASPGTTTPPAGVLPLDGQAPPSTTTPPTEAPSVGQ